MKKETPIQKRARLVRFIAALAMCACLVFLTGINFFVYSNGNKTAMEQQSASGNDEKAPENPVEEKAGNSLSSIQEEYIHELHILQGMASTAEPLKYCLQDDARLAIVHFELVTPPPDL